MKTRIITFAIYTLIFLAVGALIYFFAFWRPNRNRADQLNRDIEAALTEQVMAASREEMMPQLLNDIERLGHELGQAQSDWEHVSRAWQYEHLRFIPEVFNELDIRERIYRITTSHSHSLQVYFQYSQPLGVMNYSYGNPDSLPNGIWLTPVIISFTADYESFIAILNGFAHEWIDNRIVDYSMYRQGSQWAVEMRLDVLTQTPQPDRYWYYNVEPSG